MMKPSTITQWLMQPAKFSDKDRKEAAALIKTYPYFVPTRYIEAAEHHKKQAFAPAMQNMMYLYTGNWVLFHEFLQSSTGQLNVPATMLYHDEDETDLQDETADDIEYAADEMLEDDVDFGSYTEAEEEIIISDDKSEDEFIADEILSEEEPFGLADEEEIRKQPPVLKLKIIEEPEKEIKQETKPVTPVNNEKIKQPEKEIKQETKTPKKELKEKPADQIPFYQNRKADSLIQPIYTEDYFLHQGLHVPDELSADHQQKHDDKSLMVVMSFSEWLLHFKTKGEREKEEQQDQKALKTMWQKEKLAAALEEENEEIPETVFEMAVNSITKEEDLASESLADIMVKQGKLDKAIDMYRKLSLRNPQKKAYFARKIDELQKEKES